MSFVNVKLANDVFIWLRRATLVVAVIMAGWGASVLLGKPVTSWFATSATIGIALLLISAVWQLRGSYTAIAALALTAAVVALVQHFEFEPAGQHRRFEPPGS